MGAHKTNPNAILKAQGRENEITTPKRKNLTKKEKDRLMWELFIKSFSKKEVGEK